MTEFDRLIHAPKRLRLMTTLSSVDAAEFALLQDELELTASDLSKQMKALSDAGYVRVRKTGRGPGSSTWYSLTKRGRDAYLEYVEAMRELLDIRVPKG